MFINSSGVGLLDIEVTFRDPWQGPPQANPYVMRVTYRWRFRSEGVKMWAAVEPLATTIQEMPDPYCFPTIQPPCNPADKFLTGTPFVKEPKFLAAVVGAPTPAQGTVFTRMGVVTTNATAWGGNGSMRGEPPIKKIVHTLKSYEPLRSRVRFPSAPSAAAAALMQPQLKDSRYRCPSATATVTTPACFSVVMREFDAKKILDGGAGLQQAASNYWQSGTPTGDGYGLDQWAYDEAKIDIRALQANPDGQCNAKDKNVTDPSTGGTTRSWEWAGYKVPPSSPSSTYTARQLNNNPNPFLWSATLFLGWAGGNGPNDCQPLYRAFPTEGRQMQAPSCPRHASEAGESTVVCRYGTFAAFGLNDTFKLKAQTGDITP